MRRALVLFARLALAGSEFRTFLAECVRLYDSRPVGECPACGFTGRFRPEPRFGRSESCPQCGSLERHRLLALAVKDGFVGFARQEVLHFAPDPMIGRIIESQEPACHTTADSTPGRADSVLDIEHIAAPDLSWDRIVCSHVLEHVEDRLALAELVRVLRPGGQVVIMVPLVEGWSRTYEDAAIVGEEARAAHFLQGDHLRLYGADLRDRIAAAGFTLAEFTAGGPETVRYRLSHGEKVFLATKPEGAIPGAR